MILLVLLLISRAICSPLTVEISVIVPFDSDFIESISQQYPNSTFQVFPIICIEGVDCYNDTNVTRRYVTTRTGPVEENSNNELVVVFIGLILGTCFIFVSLLRRPVVRKRVLNIKIDLPVKSKKIKLPYLMGATPLTRPSTRHAACTTSIARCVIPAELVSRHFIFW